MAIGSATAVGFALEAAVEQVFEPAGSNLFPAEVVHESLFFGFHTLNSALVAAFGSSAAAAERRTHPFAERSHYNSSPFHQQRLLQGRMPDLDTCWLSVARRIDSRCTRLPFALRAYGHNISPPS